MAEQTEPRVNKAFVVPDTDRPAIDPGASDVADQSYDRIEELRSADASGSQYQASMAAGREGSLAANPADTSYERIEALRGERAAAGDTTPTQTVDTPPSGRDMMTGTEDPGVIESARLDRWELDQADVAKSTTGEDRSYD